MQPLMNADLDVQMLLELHSDVVDTVCSRITDAGMFTASAKQSAWQCRVPCFPVDTHIFRLAQRWGLTRGQTVEQAEADYKVSESV